MEATVKEKVNIVLSDDQHEVVRAHLSVKDFGNDKKFVVSYPQTINEKKLFLFVKRLFDIALSVCCIVLFLIPGVIISACVALTSKGPVIYSQKRLGKNGTEFDIYKFRTMGVMVAPKPLGLVYKRLEGPAFCGPLYSTETSKGNSRKAFAKASSAFWMASLCCGISQSS